MAPPPVDRSGGGESAPKLPGLRRNRRSCRKRRRHSSPAPPGKKTCSAFASLDSRINSIRSSKHDDKLDEELVKARYILSEGDAAAYLPSKSHGRFLRMFLGPINMRANRKDVQLKVKEEYNDFIDRTAYLFLSFPSLLLMLRSWIWDGCLPALPVQLYQISFAVIQKACCLCKCKL